MIKSLAINGGKSTPAALRERKRRRHPPVCFHMFLGSASKERRRSATPASPSLFRPQDACFYQPPPSRLGSHQSAFESDHKHPPPPES